MTDLEQFKKEQLEREERHRRELNLIKDMLRNQNGGLRTPQSGLSFRIQQFEEEILRWSENLNSARVTRWGGVISTPGKTELSFALFCNFTFDRISVYNLQCANSSKKSLLGSRFWKFSVKGFLITVIFL